MSQTKLNPKKSEIFTKLIKKLTSIKKELGET